jgi:hypothetical protein
MVPQELQAIEEKQELQVPRELQAQQEQLAEASYFTLVPQA